jgi:hypothetical protein
MHQSKDKLRIYFCVFHSLKGDLRSNWNYSTHMAFFVQLAVLALRSDRGLMQLVPSRQGFWPCLTGLTANRASPHIPCEGQPQTHAGLGHSQPRIRKRRTTFQDHLQMPRPCEQQAAR